MTTRTARRLNLQSEFGKHCAPAWSLRLASSFGVPVTLVVEEVGHSSQLRLWKHVWIGPSRISQLTLVQLRCRIVWSHITCWILHIEQVVFTGPLEEGIICIILHPRFSTPFILGGLISGCQLIPSGFDWLEPPLACWKQPVVAWSTDRNSSLPNSLCCIHLGVAWLVIAVAYCLSIFHMKGSQSH